MERAARVVASAVEGRLALLERFGNVVVDALVVVEGLVTKKFEIVYLIINNKFLKIPVVRVCDVGLCLAAVGLLAVERGAGWDDAVLEEAAATAPPEEAVVVEVAFIGGLVDGCDRAVGFVVEAAGTVEDEALPSGAVESIVLVWSVASEAFGTVEGRVVVFTTGLTVGRVEAALVAGAAVAEELAGGFGFTGAEWILDGASR